MLLTASIWVVLVQELEQFMTFLATDFLFFSNRKLAQAQTCVPLQNKSDVAGRAALLSRATV
jgi:hypothetical protein